MKSPIKIALIGAGSRGLMSYGIFAEKNPNIAKFVAVAEPRDWFREEACKRHSITNEMTFCDWKDLLDRPKFCDAVLIATQDATHCEIALKAISLGYDVLLEKPMATSLEDCIAIYKAAQRHGVIVGVCHVLRYAPYFQKLRELVKSKIIGDVLSLRHLEQVGYWHYAHSYVRGNWRNEKLSSPMILAKSCHDLDIISYLLGERRCTSLSSYGSLKYFKSQNKPERAAERCIDCELKKACPYSADSFYRSKLEKGEHTWPLDVVIQDFSSKALDAALKVGPYGKCVYQNDNDVVDNQIVNMLFEDNITASFTLMSCTHDSHRETEVWGSLGEIRGCGDRIVVKKFGSDQSEVFEFNQGDDSVAGGHLGGDFRLMQDFCMAIQNNDSSYLSSTTEIALMSHLMAFYAEESRKNSTTIEVSKRLAAIFS